MKKLLKALRVAFEAFKMVGTCREGFLVRRWGESGPYKDENLEKTFGLLAKSQAERYKDSLNFKDGLMGNQTTVIGSSQEYHALVFVPKDTSISAREKAIEAIRSAKDTCYIMSAKFATKNDKGSYWVVKYLSF
jgi:hypothetical protein